MKKLMLVFTVLFLGSFVNAQQWDDFWDMSEYTRFTEKKYKVIRDTKLYDRDGDVIEDLNAGQIIKSSSFAWVQDESKFPFDMFEYLIGYKGGWISTDDLVLVDSEQLPAEIITYNKQRFEKKWIPVWYNNLLSSKEKLEDYSDFYEGWKDTEDFSLWCLHNIEFNNNLLVFRHLNGRDFFSISNITKKLNVFYIDCELDMSFQLDFNDICKNESYTNLPDLTVNRDTTFIIEKNGNRLRIYNGANYKLIVELMQTDKNWMDAMVNYIKYGYRNKPSFLNVIEEKLDHPWSDPKTGLYDQSNVPAVVKGANTITPNQTMTVTENLKLRSGEATSTKVLSVMAAGTKVKILEVGKAETIDGIKSNWVKVEVEKNARDRDGKAIKAGTVGWCYGGYLR